MPTASPSASRSGGAELGPEERDEDHAGADADDGRVDAGDPVVAARRGRRAMITSRDADEEEAGQLGPVGDVRASTCGDAVRRSVAATAVRPPPTARGRGRAGARPAPPAPRGGAPASSTRVASEGRAGEDPGRRRGLRRRARRPPRPGWRQTTRAAAIHWRRAGAPPARRSASRRPSRSCAPVRGQPPAYRRRRGRRLGRGSSSNTPRIGSSGTDCRADRARRVAGLARTIARQSACGTPSVCLAIGLPALVLEPPLHARPGRLGRPARRVDPQGASRSRSREAAQGQVAVAGLRALVGGDHPHLRSRGARGGGPAGAGRATASRRCRSAPRPCVSAVLACWPPGPPERLKRQRELGERDRRASGTPAAAPDPPPSGQRKVAGHARRRPLRAPSGSPRSRPASASSRPTADLVATLLDLAGVAAHASERTAAPDRVLARRAAPGSPRRGRSTSLGERLGLH